MKKPLQSVPTQGVVELAEQNGEVRSQQADRGLSQWLIKDDALIKDN